MKVNKAVAKQSAKMPHMSLVGRVCRTIGTLGYGLAYRLGQVLGYGWQFSNDSTNSFSDG